jgi:hypothetical protein
LLANINNNKPAKKNPTCTTKRHAHKNLHEKSFLVDKGRERERQKRDDREKSVKVKRERKRRE